MKLPINEATGLVPMRVNFSDAAAGIIAGEVRGFVPEVAERMIKMGSATIYEADEKPKGEKKVAA